MTPHRLAVIGYVILSVGVVFGLWLADGARQALCSQQVALEDRVAVNEQVLRDNPTGPIYGIPRNLVVRTLERDKIALGNFHDHLYCFGDE